MRVRGPLVDGDAAFSGRGAAVQACVSPSGPQRDASVAGMGQLAQASGGWRRGARYPPGPSAAVFIDGPRALSFTEDMEDAVRTRHRARGDLAGILWRTTSAIVFAIAAVLTLAPVPAVAAEDYYVTAFDCWGRRGSGQVDSASNLYVACNALGGFVRPNVQVFDAVGTRRQTIYLNGYATDVAPSPDGAYLYVVDNQSKSARRYNRGATGAYTLDAAWKLDDYLQWGTPYRPLGEFLATDAAGNIYFSSGTWTAAPTSVIKYDSQGRFLTQFGAWENSWTTGIFYWMNSGVAVTPDGSSVYVAEVGNNRIQRFDRQQDGSYLYSWMIGNDPAIDEDARTGWCGTDVRGGRLSAPYDIGLDGAGNIYALNTSCVQVKKFAPDGTWLHTQQLTNIGGGYIHGMAVDRAGRVYLAEIGRVMHPGVEPPQYTWVTDAWYGWAYATARAPAVTVRAWKWTATGWVYTTFQTRTYVWAQPFAAGWLWVWKDGTWYAARTYDIAR